jgi:hypothetical protein
VRLSPATWFFDMIRLNDLDLVDRRDKIDAGLASFLMDKKRRGC